MEQELEKLIQKQENTAKSIASILTKNFPIEKDLAMYIANDAVVQTIGLKQVEGYKNQQFWKWIKESLPLVGRITAWVSGIIIALGFIIGCGMFIHSCANAPELPIKYSPVGETARFSLGKQTDEIRAPKGLSETTFQCLTGYGTSFPDSKQKGCIHSKKLASLNAAMDKALAEDINGVIWNEPTGDGEVWTVERNNYRFVITGQPDPNYK